MIVLRKIEKENDKMAIPNLQVALDHNRIEDALKDALAVGNEVDIIEAGTILILNEGDKATCKLGIAILSFSFSIFRKTIINS